jgi:hypothetical protein
VDVEQLAALLRETEAHHGEFERTAPPHQWSDWYAAYMSARNDGRSPEDASADAARYVATRSS